MAATSVGAICLEITADAGQMKKALNEIQQTSKKTCAQVESAFSSTDQRINAILSRTDTSLKSKAASIAAIYKKQGMNASQAMTKAWSEIERGSSSSFSAAAKNCNASMNSIERRASSMTAVFSKLKSFIISAFTITAIVNFTKSCLSLGSALNEVQNVVDVTFGDMNRQVNQWSKNALTAFGLSEKVAKQYMGTFGAMAKSFGFTTNEAFNMSAALTGLTGDVASFYNLSTDAAYTKLKSVFTGETEALKELGVVMTQNALDAYALANGYGRTTAAMSEQEKVALRLAFVQSQLAAASGDFARTSGSWANQTRILALQWESFKAALGQGFINVLTPVIQALNNLMSIVVKIAEAFANFTALIFGDAGSASSSTSSSIVADTASGLGSVAGAAGDAAKATKGATAAAKAYKKQLMGFDELNILSSPDTSGSSGGGGGGAGTALQTTVDPIDTSSTVFSKMAQDLKAWIATLPKLEFDVDWQLVKNNMIAGFKNLWAALAAWLHCVLSITILIINDSQLDRLIERLSQLWGSFTNLAKVVSENIAPALVSFYQTAISPLVQWIGEKLSDAVMFACTLLDDWSQWFTDNSTGIQQLIDFIANLTAGIWSFIEPIADAAWATFKDIISGINEAVQSLFSWIISNKELVVGALTAVAAGLLAYKTALGISSLIDFFSDATNIAAIKTNLLAIAQGALNAVMSLNPIALVVAALAALVAAFIYCWKNVDGFKEFWINTWNKIVEGAQKAWQWIKNAWNNVSSWFNEKIIVPITSFFSNLWRSIQNIFSSVKQYLQSRFSEAWAAVKNVFSGVGSFFSGIWSTIKSKFTSIGTSIGNAIGDAFKKVVNSIISFAENTINGFIKAINAAISLINTIPGVNIPKLSTLSIPKLATGGYVKANTPQLAVVGDNKHEGEIIAPESKISQAVALALAPFMHLLDKLTQVISTDSGGNIHITLMLDGKVIFDDIVKRNNDTVKRTGRSPLLT